MKQDVRLYINDMLVDFSNELSMPFTYQLEDLNNPTIIKNTFTKTITIPATNQNNKIFGEIYNFDRQQLYNQNYLIGAYFNPSFRTPFKLYRNGELIESGYMQLNTISMKNKDIQYNITLYGGLGDFFYNLSYNEDNEPLQLKDLDYNTDLSFIMDKKVVKDCWENLFDDTRNDITDYITFIPCYNGLYENFDNNKVLINTNNSTIFTYSSTTVDGLKYTPYNGYALGELNKDYTEWEMRSLLSYKQRPALKLSKFIDACCKPENNGGYTVELDEDFFNAGNPYYNKAYIALPLLEEKLEKEGVTIEDNITVNSSAWVGFKDDIGVGEDAVTSIITVVNDNIPMDENGIIDTTGLNNSTQFDIDLDLQLFFTQQENSTYKGNLYCSYLDHEDVENIKRRYKSVLLQIQAIDVDTSAIVGNSDYYNFTNLIQIPGVKWYSQPKEWVNWSNPQGIPINDVFGYFKYSDTLNKHYFISDENNNTFRIRLEKCKKVKNIKFQLLIKVVHTSTEAGIGLYKIGSLYYGNINDILVKGFWNTVADNQISKLYIKTADVSIASGQKITQDLLLKTENTPCDFLLSYCKLFGLYFSHDINSKKINITTRNNYFTTNIINIQDRIDYSKDIIINPILYDKKFYKLSLDSNESYLTEKYRNEYGVEYGQKRINTNYNFNSETVDLLENNVYQNVISTLDNSPYFRTFFNSDGIQQPPFIVDNLTYKLFNTDNNNVKETDIEIYGGENIDLSKTVNWNINDGYDFTDRLCCFSKDEKKSLADLSATLVFFDGFSFPVDLEENTVNYWLVDDVPEMFYLNEKPCFLYTEDAFDENNNWIAYKLEQIPKFSKYILNENKITDSWDLGKPKEIYIPNIVYNDNVTLYNQYWGKMYEDKLNINTKKITAYVNLMGINVNANLLKNFYYFNNCYWLLNKIENYDINSNNTVKCEFIRINNINNYTAEVGKKYDYFYIDNNYITVPYNSGNYTIKVQSTTPWEVFYYNDSKITNIFPMNGEAGTTNLTFSYNENTKQYDSSNFYISLATSGNVKNRISIFIEQLPDMADVVELHGTIKYKNGSIIENGEVFICDTGYTYVYSNVKLDDYTGEYKIFVPKDVDFGLEVQSIDSTVVFQQIYQFRTNSELNLNIV